MRKKNANKKQLIYRKDNPNFPRLKSRASLGHFYDNFYDFI